MDPRSWLSVALFRGIKPIWRGSLLVSRLDGQASLTLRHSTLFDNEADEAGGGLHGTNVEVSLEDSAVTGNSSGLEGGAGGWWRPP